MERYRPDQAARVLIDTGAQSTIVNKTLLESLCIHAKDETSVMGIHGDSSKHPVYDVRMRVVNKKGNVVLDVQDLRVVGMPLGALSYSAILGMDVLRNFTLRFLHSVSLADMTQTEHPAAEPRNSLTEG
jgi:predicted aspartyl protease